MLGSMCIQCGQAVSIFISLQHIPVTLIMILVHESVLLCIVMSFECSDRRGLYGSCDRGCEGLLEMK